MSGLTGKSVLELAAEHRARLDRAFAGIREVLLAPVLEQVKVFVDPEAGRVDRR
jgi:hypothetical protein